MKIRIECDSGIRTFRLVLGTGDDVTTTDYFDANWDRTNEPMGETQRSEIYLNKKTGKLGVDPNQNYSIEQIQKVNSLMAFLPRIAVDCLSLLCRIPEHTEQNPATM